MMKQFEQWEQHYSDSLRNVKPEIPGDFTAQVMGAIRQLGPSPDEYFLRWVFRPIATISGIAAAALVFYNIHLSNSVAEVVAFNALTGSGMWSM